MEVLHRQPETPPAKTAHAEAERAIQAPAGQELSISMVEMAPRIPAEVVVPVLLDLMAQDHQDKATGVMASPTALQTFLQLDVVVVAGQVVEQARPVVADHPQHKTQMAPPLQLTVDQVVADQVAVAPGTAVMAVRA